MIRMLQIRGSLSDPREALLKPLMQLRLSQASYLPLMARVGRLCTLSFTMQQNTAFSCVELGLVL